MFTPNVKIKGIQPLSFSALALSLVVVLLCSCKENISTVGSDYVSDSVVRGAATYSEANALRFESIFKPTVSAEGLTYNLNLGSPYLFVGSVSTEQLSAWSLIKIPIIQDSVGQVLDDSLILNMNNGFYYSSDGSSTLLEFDVYIATGITDSAATVSASQLVGSPIAHYSAMLDADSTRRIALQLDSSRLFPLLRTTQLALAIVPTSNMNSVRAFASNDNGNASLSPTLQLQVVGPSGAYLTKRTPEFDYHVVSETAIAPSGSFELRACTALREQIVVDTKYIRTQLGLSRFATINSGILQITTDPTQHTTGTTPVDSNVPVLFYRDSVTADSIAVIADLGSHSATDQNVLTYQIRTIIEYAVRHQIDTLVFELRNGYGKRPFGTTSIYVEDYNLDRWMIYSQSAADETKRPKLLVTFSYLK